MNIKKRRITAADESVTIKGTVTFYSDFKDDRAAAKAAIKQQLKAKAPSAKLTCREAGDGQLDVTIKCANSDCDRAKIAVESSGPVKSVKWSKSASVANSSRRTSKRRVMAADSDYIKIGNRILPRNTAGMKDEASYDQVSREGRRRYDAEQEQKRLAAEKAAKAERGRAGSAAFDRILEAHEGEPNRNELWSDLFEEFVPSSGPAETMGGEIIRAVNRVIYRWENDGDKFNEGYGLETCGSDAAFLSENTDSRIENIIENAAELDPSAPDERYSAAMKKLEEAVIDFLANNPEVFGEDAVDSRNYESYLVDDWEEASHSLEYEPDTSGDYIDRLIDAECVSWDDVDQLLRDWAEYDLGGEVNRWAQDAWTITNLDSQQFEEWDSTFDRWWGQALDDWMNEYSDELDAYENGEEEDEEYYEEDEEEDIDSATRTQKKPVTASFDDEEEEWENEGACTVWVDREIAASFGASLLQELVEARVDGINIYDVQIEENSTTFYYEIDDVNNDYTTDEVNDMIEIAVQEIIGDADEGQFD